MAGHRRGDEMEKLLLRCICRRLALRGTRGMSDLSPQSGPERTLTNGRGQRAARRYGVGRAPRSILRQMPLRDEVVELHLRLRSLERTRMLHDLPVRVAATVELDVGFGVPFRIGDELVRLPAAKELRGDAALLPDHERRAV